MCGAGMAARTANAGVEVEKVAKWAAQLGDGEAIGVLYDGFCFRGADDSDNRTEQLLQETLDRLHGG